MLEASLDQTLLEHVSGFDLEDDDVIFEIVAQKYNLLENLGCKI